MSDNPTVESTCTTHPLAGIKRPLEESSIPNTNKRPVTKKDSEVSTAKNIFPPTSDPLMIREDAEKAIKATHIPKAPKKQTQYARFKSVMLKEAKAKGDEATIKDITARAKSAWQAVKDQNVEHPEHDCFIVEANGTDVDPFLLLKVRIITEERNEAAAYEKELNQFKSDFLSPALAILWWNEKSMDKSNIDTFKKDADQIHSKAVVAYGSSGQFSTEFKDAYEKFIVKKESIMKEIAMDELVEKLKDAPKDVLLRHAQEHLDLLAQVEELNVMKAKAIALEAEKKKDEEKELAGASHIMSDICRELKKQMVYTNPSLKHKAKKISYKRSGVSLKVFAAAFGVPQGTKQYKFPGHEVGTKSLRYSDLGCTDVTVKLVGDEMTASTSYMFVQNMPFFF